MRQEVRRALYWDKVDREREPTWGRRILVIIWTLKLISNDKNLRLRAYSKESEFSRAIDRLACSNKIKGTEIFGGGRKAKENDIK